MTSLFLKLSIVTILLFAVAEKTLGQESSSVLSCEPNLDTKLLDPKIKNISNNIVDITTISQTHPTIPSLWWAKEQFDPFGGKMVDNWLAYKEEKRIDLVVNFQLWSLLDYLGRYRFVDNFGNIARQYGYNLRVFSQQKRCLALYYYNTNSDPPRWEISFGSSNQNGLQLNK